jgi:hypothetical protein
MQRSAPSDSPDPSGFGQHPKFFFSAVFSILANFSIFSNFLN